MGPVIDDLKIFSGNSHPELATSVCEYLNIPGESLADADNYRYLLAIRCR